MTSNFRRFLIEKLDELDKNGFEGVVKIKVDLVTEPFSDSEIAPKPKLEPNNNDEPSDKEKKELGDFIKLLALILGESKINKDESKSSEEDDSPCSCKECSKDFAKNDEFSEKEKSELEDFIKFLTFILGEGESSKDENDSPEEDNLPCSCGNCDCKQKTTPETKAETNTTVNFNPTYERRKLRKNLLSKVLTELVNDNVSNDKDAIKKYAGVVTDIILLSDDKGCFYFNTESKNKLAKKNQYSIESLPKILGKLVNRDILCKPSKNVYTVNPKFFERVVG